MLVWTALAFILQQPPVAMTNSPPPVVAVPYVPGPPGPAFPAIVAPPPPSGKIVREPQARQEPQLLISSFDYPSSAIVRGEAGTVAFRVDVGPDGRVRDCTVTRSSGSAALDSATCQIMRRRARFTPARDSNGMPVAASVSDQLRWTLP